MKNECNIVKDLLPLYIDGALSEDSRKLVEEHAALCESCARERQEMMLALPREHEPDVEQKVLAKAAKNLRRRHMRRGGLLTVAGLLLGVLLIFSANWLHWYLWEDGSVPMALDQYDVRMSTLESGQLIFSLVPNGQSQAHGWGAHYENAPDGSGRVMILSVYTTRLQRASDVRAFPSSRGDLLWQDGRIMMREGSPIVTIAREGPKGEREVLYQYGADESLIAPASDLMEEYYMLEEISQVYTALVLGRHGNDWLVDYLDQDKLPYRELDDEHALNERIATAVEQMARLRDLVPEWQ